MEIEWKRKPQVSNKTLDEMNAGVNVFRFDKEYSDECDVMMVVNTIELADMTVRPGKKVSKSFHKFSVPRWLEENSFIAVVNIATGIITIHTKETKVVLLKHTLFVAKE